jgi:hypothetical protein
MRSTLTFDRRRGEQRVKYDEATARLLALARTNEGTLTWSQVEDDATLASERDLVSAAAHALAGSTNVFSNDEDDGRAWFPYSSLTFSEPYGAARRAS